MNSKNILLVILDPDYFFKNKTGPGSVVLTHSSGWNGGRVQDGRQHSQLHHEGRQAVHDHGR